MISTSQNTSRWCESSALAWCRQKPSTSSSTWLCRSTYKPLRPRTAWWVGSPEWPGRGTHPVLWPIDWCRLKEENTHIWYRQAFALLSAADQFTADSMCYQRGACERWTLTWEREEKQPHRQNLCLSNPRVVSDNLCLIFLQETDTEYGNLPLKHQPASRKASKWVASACVRRSHCFSKLHTPSLFEKRSVSILCQQLHFAEESQSDRGRLVAAPQF